MTRGSFKPLVVTWGVQSQLHSKLADQSSFILPSIVSLKAGILIFACSTLRCPWGSSCVLSFSRASSWRCCLRFLVALSSILFEAESLIRPGKAYKTYAMHYFRCTPCKLVFFEQLWHNYSHQNITEKYSILRSET